MTLILYACHRLSASITREQCHRNRKTCGACTGCPGLPEQPAGMMVQDSSPGEELAAAEIPSVTLRFESPEDRELFEVLERICSDLEYDIISLLHLACRNDLSRMKGMAKTRD
ncbi:MAG: hypothetical protein C5B59_01410 [Bacteroidetes bacterium]|nr:MAG: hypothetical protein C5B59_01410 [Bacteroidota bacterium]